MTATFSAPLEISETVPFAQLAGDRYAALRPSEQRVVDHLRELDPASSVATAGAVALALGVSQATVVNAVQRLGYEGFGAFRRTLIAERALERVRVQTELPAAEGPDPLLEIAARAFALDREVLERTAALVGEGFRRAVAVLGSAPQVFCFGSELSAVVARLAAGTFKKYGIRAAAEEHVTEQLAQVDVADPSAALLVVSYRGENPQLVAVAQHARERGMPVVALTNSAWAPLAREADVVLLTGGPVLPKAVHPSQTGARGAQLSLVRALAEAIAWTRRQEAPESAQAAHTAAPGDADKRGD